MSQVCEFGSQLSERLSKVNQQGIWVSKLSEGVKKVTESSV